MCATRWFRLLSSRLSGANSFPAGNLHDVPGASFECGIAPLRTISALTRDFHFRLQPYNSTSCSDRKMSQENTQKEQNREKKKYIYCALRVGLDKHCACILPSRYKGLCLVASLRVTKDEYGDNMDSVRITRPGSVTSVMESFVVSSTTAPCRF